MKTNQSNGKVKVEGEFSLTDGGEFSPDLKELYELIVRNIDFNAERGAFVGFAESNKQVLIQELKAAGTPYKDRLNDLIIFVNNPRELENAFRSWAEEAGAANYFFLIISSIEYGIEEIAQQYLSSGQKPPESSLVLEDISDGDRNLFSIETAVALS